MSVDLVMKKCEASKLSTTWTRHTITRQQVAEETRFSSAWRNLGLQNNMQAT